MRYEWWVNGSVAIFFPVRFICYYIDSAAHSFCYEIIFIKRPEHRLISNFCQEPLTRSVQLPHIPVTALWKTGVSTLNLPRIQNQLEPQWPMPKNRSIFKNAVKELHTPSDKLLVFKFFSFRTPIPLFLKPGDWNSLNNLRSIITHFIQRGFFSEAERKLSSPPFEFCYVHSLRQIKTDPFSEKSKPVQPDQCLESGDRFCINLLKLPQM